MIIVKKNDRVYFAYPLCVYIGNNDEFMSEKTALLKDNLPFFKLKGNDSIIMGSGYNMAGVDIVRYRKDIGPENHNLDDEFIYFDFKKKMDAIIEGNPYMRDEDGDISQDYFIAQKDKAYIYYDGDSYDIKDVYSRRTGYNCLKLLNEKLPDASIEQLLFKFGNVAEETDRKCMFPMVYTDTISQEVNLLNRDGTTKFLYKL